MAHNKYSDIKWIIGNGTFHKYFFAIVFLISFSNCYSQNIDSLKWAYNNRTIYRYGSYFLKGTERLSFRELEGEFSMSDIGLASYKKAKKYKTKSIILRCASVLAGFATVFFIADNQNQTTAYTLLGTQFVFIFGATQYNTLSQQNLDRSLWIRNRDILLGAK